VEKVEITKKQFTLYTIILLMLAGSVSLVIGGKPDEIKPLWEHIWKVEEPVTVDGTVDIGNEVTITPSTVPTPGKSVIVWENEVLTHYGNVKHSDVYDVSGYKTVYVYVWYTSQVSMHCRFLWERDSGPTLEWYEELGFVDPGEYKDMFVTEIKGPEIKFIIMNEEIGTNTITVVAYFSPV
jgi:hypothetical protein